MRCVTSSEKLKERALTSIDPLQHQDDCFMFHQLWGKTEYGNSSGCRTGRDLAMGEICRKTGWPMPYLLTSATSIWNTYGWWSFPTTPTLCCTSSKRSLWVSHQCRRRTSQTRKWERMLRACSDEIWWDAGPSFEWFHTIIYIYTSTWYLLCNISIYLNYPWYVYTYIYNYISTWAENKTIWLGKVPSRNRGVSYRSWRSGKPLQSLRPLLDTLITLWSSTNFVG